MQEAQVFTRSPDDPIIRSPRGHEKFSIHDFVAVPVGRDKLQVLVGELRGDAHDGIIACDGEGFASSESKAAAVREAS